MPLYKKLYYLFLTVKPIRAVTHVDYFLGILVMLPYRNIGLWQGLSLFVSFLCFYTVIYQVNEIIDLKRDREDPVRAMRPLASGKVTVREISVFASILLAISILLAVYTQPIVLIAYLVLLAINLAYVGFLKWFAYLDIFVVSLTRAIKLPLGALVVTTVPLMEIFPWLTVLMYGIMLCFHANKQYARLQSKRLTQQRKFGSISASGLLYTSLIGLSLAAVSTYVTPSPLTPFLWAAVIYNLGYTLVLRMPHANFLYRIEKWVSSV